MRNSYSSKAIVLLGYGLLASALLLAAGCQSLGKRNPLSSSEIPVLTRNEDVEYPPPSAAAAPTALSTGADSGSQLANSPSNLIANSGDQTTAGIEYPSTQPNASAAAPGNYPATNYQAFPKQPEALRQTSPATQNSGGFVGTASQPSAARASNDVATSPATPINSTAVQQGLYPVKPTSTVTGQSTPQAATTASGGGNWPVPLATTESAPAATRYPVDQATHTSPRSDVGGYGSRASEFGGGTVAETIASSGNPAPTSPPAAPIATYVDPTGPGVATTAHESAGSHYEQMSTASAPSPKTEWRPGSTSNLPMQR